MGEKNSTIILFYFFIYNINFSFSSSFPIFLPLYFPILLYYFSFFHALLVRI